MSRRPVTQAHVVCIERPEPLNADVARLVEGIALTLAAEHHALENGGKGLSGAAGLGSDAGQVHHLEPR